MAKVPKMRSAGGSGGGKVSSARELRMFLKNRWWKEHKFVLIAVFGIIISLFATSIYKYSTNTKAIQHIQVSNSKQLYHVFKSGEPWIVLCTDPDTVLNKVFNKASKKLLEEINVGVLDCTQQLPSGKSVLERFSIRDNIKPTVFTVANGGKPKQIFLNYLQTSKALRNYALEQTRKKLHEIQSTKHLDTKCLDKTICALILRGQKFSAYQRQWLNELMKSHRKVQFAWIDSTRHKLSIESGLPTYKSGINRFILFKNQKINNENGKEEKNLTAKAHRDDFEYFPMKMFMEKIQNENLKQLSKRPTLIKRQIPKPSSSTNSNIKTNTKSSSSFPSSKKGEKTPEEILKEENQRREQMKKREKEYFPQKQEIIEENEINEEEHEEEIIDLEDE